MKRQCNGPVSLCKRLHVDQSNKRPLDDSSIPDGKRQRMMASSKRPCPEDVIYNSKRLRICLMELSRNQMLDICTKQIRIYYDALIIECEDVVIAAVHSINKLYSYLCMHHTGHTLNVPHSQ